jgi:hypothetical protein
MEWRTSNETKIFALVDLCGDLSDHCDRIRPSRPRERSRKFSGLVMQASAPRRVLTTKGIEERGTNRSCLASKQPNRDLSV